MDLVLTFFAGMFLLNSVPHIVSGVIGKTHMTPLGKDSSALLNVAWGFVNLVLGAYLLHWSGRGLSGAFSLDTASWVFLAGVAFMALADAWLFSNPNARFPWFK